MNDTPERLIRAARRIFAEKGYDAASVREITAAASANLGAITYHFGSKQALYEAVLDRAMEPLSAKLGLDGASPGAAPAEAEGHTPLDRLDAIVAALFDHLAANPDLPLLVLQQAVVRRSAPAPLLRRLGPLLERLAGEIREGQRDGSIRPGDPWLLAISSLAQPIYFGLLRRLAPDLLGGGGGPTPNAETISAHARAFIRASLATGLEATNG